MLTKSFLPPKLGLITEKKRIIKIGARPAESRHGFTVMIIKQGYEHSLSSSLGLELLPINDRPSVKDNTAQP